MERHLQRQNSKLICFNYIVLGTLLFNFQKFWGGGGAQAPPAPPPATGLSAVPLLLCFFLTAVSLLSQAMLPLLCAFLVSPSSSLLALSRY